MLDQGRYAALQHGRAPNNTAAAGGCSMHLDVTASTLRGRTPLPGYGVFATLAQSAKRLVESSIQCTTDQ